MCKVPFERYQPITFVFLCRWFAVLLYLLFLMMTLIIMLNLLIAQMSDTYAKVQQNARAIATFSRARFMVRYLFILGHVHARRVSDCTSVRVPALP